MSAPAPFLIFALPRSRTFWLSRYLTMAGRFCGHEQLRNVRGLADVQAWLEAGYGSAETAAAPWWRLLRRMAPDARVLIVRREPSAVFDSLLTTGINYDLGKLAYMLGRADAKLDQIAARWPGAMQVRYHELDDEGTIAAITKHCLDAAHEPARWSGMAGMNLQCDLPRLLIETQIAGPRLNEVAAQFRQMELGALWQFASNCLQDVTLQLESFAPFYADPNVQATFRKHLVSVGESPDNVQVKNSPMMEAADRNGNMQLLVARSGPHCLGYLMTLFSPSWENIAKRTAVNTLFYADPRLPGLGLRLLREGARLAACRADELYLRAGPRGDGPRLGLAYARLGAVPDGELYKMDLASWV